MRTIIVDAGDWRSEDDVLDGLLEALDAPDWHGRTWDALNDSIVTGGVNGVEPPYHLHLTGHRTLPEDLRQWVQDLVALITEARTRDRDVSISVAAALGLPNVR